MIYKVTSASVSWCEAKLGWPNQVQQTNQTKHCFGSAQASKHRTAAHAWSLCQVTFCCLHFPGPKRKTSFHIKLKKQFDSVRNTKMPTLVSAQSKCLSVVLLYYFLVQQPNQKLSYLPSLFVYCLFQTYLLPSLLKGREGSRWCNGARWVVSIQYRCMKACNTDT